MAERQRRSDETGALCETAREAVERAQVTPPHERGFLIAALANHVRDCGTCRDALNRGQGPRSEPTQPGLAAGDADA